MKKLIGTVAVAALIASAAFAEISIGGWGRGLWSVVGYDGDLKMTQGTSWNNKIPRIGVTVTGDSENVGFAFAFHADGGHIGIHDIAYVWAKPWDFLKVSIGQIQDDTLRVCNGFGQFNWLRGGAGKTGEDLTFRRIGGYSGYKDGGEFRGAEIALTPIEGLYIAAAFKMADNAGEELTVTDGKTTAWGNYDDKATTEFVDVLKRSQYAVGYTIDSLLAIKAQYIGSNNLDNYHGIINAAVDLLMIENNYISVGAYIPTDFDKQIAVSAVYSGGFDALSLKALVGAMINKGDQKDLTGLEIGVGVGYDLGNGIGIEGDVRTELGFPKGGDANGNITIGAFLTKGFANGVCGVGAEVGIPFGEGGTVDLMTLDGWGGSNKVHFAIPVKVEYWF